MSGRLLILVLILAALSAGCWDQRIVEQMEFIANGGVDVRPDGKILVTMTAPSLQTGGQPKPILYETVADTLRQAREKHRRQSNGRLEAGKMEQVIFGEAMARRGILDYLDILVRDPFNPMLARVVIAKGSAQEFLEQAVKWRNLLSPGLYLRRLFDHATLSGDIPENNINIFLTDYYAPGLDPILPLVEATPTRANVLGSALLRDDKLVGELTADETFLVTVLQGRLAMHTQALPLPRRLARGKRMMSIRFNGGKAKCKLKVKAGVPEVAYEVKFQALLDEFHLGFPITDKVLKDIETSAAGTLKKQFAKVWAKLRRANSDPVGLGNQVRAKHYDYWLKHDWREVFPRAEVRFKVKVDILNYGVIR